MNQWLILFIALALPWMLATPACSPPTQASGQRSIVVTYSILGSIVKELLGDQARVTISVPNGLDPHDWEPSAKDIEAINHADLVIQNGLDLEGGMQKTLAQAKTRGVRFFTASDFITVRHVGAGEGVPSGDLDQVLGASDPHLWMDPIAMKSVVAALAEALKFDLDLDVGVQAARLESRLDSLNGQVADILAIVPGAECKLVTGHESMGYFAQRYGFKLVGVIVPSLSSQAEAAAKGLAQLKQTIRDTQVKAVFTELGTSPAVAKAIGDETGVRVVELTTHTLPADGSYFTFLNNVANTIAEALK
jgi:zinc/manganese transport system substrate-binding protein